MVVFMRVRSVMLGDEISTQLETAMFMKLNFIMLGIRILVMSRVSWSQFKDRYFREGRLS